MNSEFKGVASLIAGVIGFIVFLIFAWSSYYTVDQGDRAVILHYGAVAGVSGPGLHFKVPFVTSVEHITIQPITTTIGGSKKEDEMQTYSKDQQPAGIRISVTWQVTDPVAIYSSYGNVQNVWDRIIQTRLYQQTKDVFGRYDAVEAIQDRARLNADVAQSLQTAMKGQPFVIVSVQIENIDFSDKYEQAVEDRMEATVRQQQAEAEKQRRIINADAAAYEVKAQADAKAHQIEVQGSAEAGAIKARGDALRDNPNLVALTTAEKWNGELPTTMVPGGGVPMISLNK